ncbi:MAG: hypothetical protein JSS81_07455 [Acidobacteria bacterium]|nr:hypothetical protein [Acidobacteriota bacterium]
MAFDLDTVKKQAIALMNLSTRNLDGTPVYSTALGDTSYGASEIARGAQNAATSIMRAICETDGHPHRYFFDTILTLTHQEKIPDHYGSIGVPRITPYSGAGYALTGKRKSVEEILSYRANPNYYYSKIAHDAAGSKLAGYYAIENNIFYFTGFSADAAGAVFTESSYTALPDSYYPLAIELTIAALKKDGDLSDIFAYYERRSMEGLQVVRAQGTDQPSPKKTIGRRDSGDK